MTQYIPDKTPRHHHSDRSFHCFHGPPGAHHTSSPQWQDSQKTGPPGSHCQKSPHHWEIEGCQKKHKLHLYRW